MTTLKLAAAVVPKVTAVAPRKLVPLIVTEVPPAAGPDDGLKPVTVGAARYVNTSAGDVGEVPLGVVTVTSTGPGLELTGLLTVIDVALLTV